MISSAVANPVLTSLLVKFAQSSVEFVAEDLFPIFLTPLQSAQYYVFDAANMLNAPTDIGRAPSGRYSRSRMVLSDDSFLCKEFGHEEPVDDDERKKYAFAFDADTAAIRRLAWIIMLNRELRVQKKVAALAGNAPVALWDDYQTSNPFGDVDAGREAIHNQTGLDPTLLVLPRSVFNVLKEHPKVLDKIKYTQAGVVTEQILAAAFKIPKVKVAGGIQNSANEGQAITPAQIWGKDVVLAHTDSAQDLQAPSFGRSFAWTANVGGDGYVVESYREDNIRSDVHRARQSLDEKVLGAEAGYRIAGAIS